MLGVLESQFVCNFTDGLPDVAHICSFATSNKLSNSVSKTGKDIAVQMLTGDKPAIHTSACWDISMDSFSFFVNDLYTRL